MAGLKSTYLNTKTVCIAGSQQPDTVVGESIEKLLPQVGLLLLSLLLQSSIAAVRGILHQHSTVKDRTVAREAAVTTEDKGKASLSDTSADLEHNHGCFACQQKDMLMQVLHWDCFRRADIRLNK